MRIHQILFLLILLITSVIGRTQCNGLNEICNKRYDQVAYLTTHNAFNAQTEGFSFPNQNFGLTQQMNDGVRGLMIDVYDQNGTPVVYHGSSILGSQHLSENFDEIKIFLDNNPNEIITIIFEAYVTANAIESVLIGTGLDTYLYSKPSGDWDLTQTMIDNNTRLVIFSDQDDASPTQTWYHYVWDHSVETHYSVNSPNDFNNIFNRGDSINDLFIFNHFVTDAILGIGEPNEAIIVNTYSFLMSRIEDNYSEKLKFPNFITLDFHDLGDGKQVVDSLNTDVFTSLNDQSISRIKITPNPSITFAEISGLDANQTYTIHLLDMAGEMIATKSVRSKSHTKLRTDILSRGVYMVQIRSEYGENINKRLIVN